MMKKQRSGIQQDVLYVIAWPGSAFSGLWLDEWKNWDRVLKGTEY